MSNMPLGYTTQQNVINFANRPFTEVSSAEFNTYLSATETYINNVTGYNAQTTLSGILAENITREKAPGKIDNYGNLVVDVMKPPIQFDPNGNPYVTLLEFNFGGVRVPLTLTDGTTNTLNTVLEVSETRNKIVYPSLYFMPYLPTVTPTQKVNLYNLRDAKFWVDVSYTGGYRTVPADIQLAANYLCLEMLTKRDNPNEANAVRQGQYQIQFFPSSNRYVKGEPINKTFAIVNELLSPYTRWTW